MKSLLVIKSISVLLFFGNCHDYKTDTTYKVEHFYNVDCKQSIDTLGIDTLFFSSIKSIDINNLVVLRLSSSLSSFLEYGVLDISSQNFYYGISKQKQPIYFTQIKTEELLLLKNRVTNILAARGNLNQFIIDSCQQKRALDKNLNFQLSFIAEDKNKHEVDIKKYYW